MTLCSASLHVIDIRILGYLRLLSPSWVIDEAVQPICLTITELNLPVNKVPSENIVEGMATLSDLVPAFTIVPALRMIGDVVEEEGTDRVTVALSMTKLCRLIIRQIFASHAVLLQFFRF